MNPTDPVERHTRRRIRWLFLCVGVVFLLQFTAGKLGEEPVPGLFGPSFGGDGNGKSRRRPTPPEPRLAVRFQDGTERNIPLRSLVQGVYYKQQERWVEAFHRHLEDADERTRARLVAWLVEALPTGPSGSEPAEIRWTHWERDGSVATEPLWARRPAGD